MVELGFMSQEEYDNSFAEIIRGMYGCFDDALLYFVLFQICSEYQGFSFDKKQRRSVRVFQKSEKSSTQNHIYLLCEKLLYYRKPRICGRNEK